jgi:hypothetical protein
MKTIKRRNKTIDLGTVSSGTYSKEIDLTSFTHAVLYIVWPGTYASSIQVDVEFSPTEFGETADWYERFSPVSNVDSSALEKHRIYFKGTFGGMNNRALPVGLPMNPNLNAGWLPQNVPFGEVPIPRRLRLKPDQTLEMYVQLSREIG